MAAFQKNNESIFCLDFSPAGLIYHVSHMPFSLEAFQGFQVSCEAFLLRSCSVLNYVYAYFKKNSFGSGPCGKMGGKMILEY